MLLKNKTAVIYGGGGAIGGAVALAFAGEGAHVHLAGRTLDPLVAVADRVRAAGGSADVAVVDALDEAAVGEHLAVVAEQAGRIDVSFNLISHEDLHGVPLLDISAADFFRPIEIAVMANFHTMRSAARRMVEQASGVILTLTSPPAKMVGPLMGGTAIAESAIETFTRGLAAEIGIHGVRVVGLRSEGIPGSWAEDWHTNVFDSPIEATDGLDPEGHANTLAEKTMLRRTPTLAEMTAVAVFLASDRAAAMTGTITNMTCGSVPD
ncbi:short-chain dehydrogenase/reductase SDR [Alloactinosynnema sp. L-07]|uniref:SDR family NAD(P)-dependent oxidoreductase n=1 Tax=Alloactinosynnema sp. L-07 TaxID=1653480 RepID=UPI00065EFEED|nr:SDR family oxidoreductase [Alloactinosynnema sp. L-07]CRK56510.1 short-chain dehydrogenase/reductase SDR [Alloactinosynnema sp. L-07]